MNLLCGCCRGSQSLIEQELVFVKDVSFPEADWAAFQCRLDEGELQLLEGERLPDQQSPTWKIRLSRCEITLNSTNRNISVIRISHPVRRVIDIRASVSANTKALFESIINLQSQFSSTYDDYLDVFSCDSNTWAPTYVYINSKTRILEMYRHDRESTPTHSLDLREYILIIDSKSNTSHNSFSIQQSTSLDSKSRITVFRCKSAEEVAVWTSIIKSLARTQVNNNSNNTKSESVAVALPAEKDIEMKTISDSDKLTAVDSKREIQDKTSHQHHESTSLSSLAYHPAPFAMKGNLWKKGTGNKLFGGHRWKRRYFEVDNIFFLFYKHKGARQPAARVCLQGYVTREDPDKKYNYHFHLVNTTTHSKRSFNLRSETSEEFEDWMRSLHSTINYANSQANMHNEHGHVEGEFDNFDDDRDDNDNASVADSVHT